MATNCGEDEDEARRLEERLRTLMDEKKAVFEMAKETDKKLVDIRMEETATQQRLQQLREIDAANEQRERLESRALAENETMRQELKTLRAENAELKSNVSSMQARLENERVQAAAVRETNEELAKLRRHVTEQSTSVTELKCTVQRVTTYSKIQQKKAASLKDEIAALRQISAETQRRQMDELQADLLLTKQKTRQPRATARTEADSYADVLRRLYSELSGTLDAQTVARNMFQCNALTLKELQSIEHKRSKPVKAAEHLLNIVICQSTSVYGWFVHALKESGQQHVYELIAQGNCQGFHIQFAHSERIQQHYVFLVDHLSAKHSGLVAELYQSGVLSQEERDSVSLEVMSFTQNEKLLSVLSRKTKDQFDIFVDALDTTGQSHVRSHITSRPDQGNGDKVSAALLERLQPAKELTITAHSESHHDLGDVLHVLPKGEDVLGVTQLDIHIYILRDKSTEQIEVYDIDSYNLQTRINVSGLSKTCDIIACAHYRCLYISGADDQCIYKVSVLPDAGKTQWPVGDAAGRLSLTDTHGVLVTCCKVGQIKEFSTEGTLLHRVQLAPDIVSPWHAIPLSNGQFIVSHGSYLTDSAHRVCLVGSDGHVVKSYGGRPGSGSQQMDVALHLAVDKDGSVCVADVINRRVLLLSPELTYVRDVVSSDQLKWWPCRLCLDADRRSLYVADCKYNFADDDWVAGRLIVVRV